MRGATASSGRPVQSERSFQTAVIQLARLQGFRVYHTHDSRKSEPGFPDLVLARERIVFVELKAQKTRITDEQLDWQQALNEAGAEIHFWRPSDWPVIERILSRPSTERTP
jgi:hypothetical protein